MFGIFMSEELSEVRKIFPEDSRLVLDGCALATQGFISAKAKHLVTAALHFIPIPARFMFLVRIVIVGLLGNKSVRSKEHYFLFRHALHLLHEPFAFFFGEMLNEVERHHGIKTLSRQFSQIFFNVGANVFGVDIFFFCFFQTGRVGIHTYRKIHCLRNFFQRGIKPAANIAKRFAIIGFFFYCIGELSVKWTKEELVQIFFKVVHNSSAKVRICTNVHAEDWKVGIMEGWKEE